MATFTIVAGANGAGRALSLASEVRHFKTYSFWTLRDCRSMKVVSIDGGSPIDAGRAVLDRGYRVRLLYVGTDSVEINMEPAQARVAKGGHDVPVEDQRRR